MQEDRRSFFEQLRDVPVVTSPEIVGQWAVIACQREPWRSMPLDDLLGELPLVASALLREMPRHDDQQPTLLELCARSHGSFRRRQGVPAPVLTQESNMLGETLRAVLQSHGVSDAMADDLVALIGRDLQLVRRAMSSGYSDGPSCPRP